MSDRAWLVLQNCVAIAGCVLLIYNEQYFAGALVLFFMSVEVEKDKK